MTSEEQAPRSVRFRATLELHGRTATGIEVPPDAVERLARGRRPPVRVRIGQHSYRSTVAVMGGRYLVGVSAENRAAAGVAAGDEVDVELTVDEAPREVDVPAELEAALSAEPELRRAFDALSYSARLRHALGVRDARTDATRARRLAGTLAALRSVT